MRKLILLLILTLVFLTSCNTNSSPERNEVQTSQYYSDSETEIISISETERQSPDICEIENSVSIAKCFISEVNTLGGVSINILFKSKSEKEIKYVYFYAEPYNRVGDTEACEITGDSLAVLKSIGPYNKIDFPLEFDENSPKYFYDANRKIFQQLIADGSKYSDDFLNLFFVDESQQDRIYNLSSFENVWYNQNISNVKITSIKIDYADGTSLTIPNENISLVTETLPDSEFSIYNHTAGDFLEGYNNFLPNGLDKLNFDESEPYISENSKGYTYSNDDNSVYITVSITNKNNILGAVLINAGTEENLFKAYVLALTSYMAPDLSNKDLYDFVNDLNFNLHNNPSVSSAYYNFKYDENFKLGNVTVSSFSASVILENIFKPSETPISD